jgi:hypothetical protein
VRTLKALVAQFGGGKASAVPPTLQIRRPLIRNDTVIVLLYVTRPAIDMPNGETGYFELDEYDVRMSISGGWPRVISCEAPWHATVKRSRSLQHH